MAPLFLWLLFSVPVVASNTVLCGGYIQRFAQVGETSYSANTPAQAGLPAGKDTFLGRLSKRGVLYDSWASPRGRAFGGGIASYVPGQNKIEIWNEIGLKIGTIRLPDAIDTSSVSQILVGTRKPIIGMDEDSSPEIQSLIENPNISRASKPEVSVILLQRDGLFFLWTLEEEYRRIRPLPERNTYHASYYEILEPTNRPYAIDWRRAPQSFQATPGSKLILPGVPDSEGGFNVLEVTSDAISLLSYRSSKKNPTLPNSNRPIVKNRSIAAIAIHKVINLLAVAFGDGEYEVCRWDQSKKGVYCGVADNVTTIHITGDDDGWTVNSMVTIGTSSGSLRSDYLVDKDGNGSKLLEQTVLKNDGSPVTAFDSFLDSGSFVSVFGTQSGQLTWGKRLLSYDSNEGETKSLGNPILSVSHHGPRVTTIVDNRNNPTAHAFSVPLNGAGAPIGGTEHPKTGDSQNRIRRILVIRQPTWMPL